MSGYKKKRSGGVFETSLLIQYLTRFSGFVYRTFLAGILGWVFTSYEVFADAFASSVLVRKIKAVSNYRIFHLARRIKRYVALTYERSFLLTQIRGLSTRFLTAKLNTFGLFFFAYGAYLMILQVFRVFSAVQGEPVLRETVIGCIFAIGGFFMLFSNKSFACAVYDSRFLRWLLLDCLGIPDTNLAEAARQEAKSGLNIPFIFAILCGFLSMFIEPLLIFFAIVLFVLLFVLFSYPESFVVAVFFAIPFVSTMQLCAFVCLIFFSYILKLICGRRVFRFHMLDIAILGFLAFLVFGGVVAISVDGFPRMLLMVCFMGMYFVIKNLISSSAMVKRCLYALVNSSIFVSVYGIYQNYFGDVSTQWQDMEIFFDIKGRAVSFFENPNVLGEFLILILPITIALMVTSNRSQERFFMFAVAMLNCWCLMFTWSRGAWIGFIAAMVLFLFVSGKHFFTAGLLSLPWIGTVLYLKNDALVLKRLTNFTDSSTSYRVGIWKGVLRMMEDFWVGGIGVGEEAFRKIYPIYALAGVEVAPHAHNLYLQIAVEMGVFALIVFLAFIFLYAQFSFSFCKSAMNRSNRTICLGIFCGILAILIQGMTDYIWYNYRIFLLFWMIVGLGVAHVITAKDTDEEMDHLYF